MTGAPLGFFESAENGYGNQGVSISAATACSQSRCFLPRYLFGPQQLQQIALQEGQASTQGHHTSGHIFLSNQLGAAGQIKVISPKALHPLVHAVLQVCRECFACGLVEKSSECGHECK